MRRAVLLIAVVTFSLAACSSSSKSGSGATTTSGVTTTTVAATTTAASTTTAAPATTAATATTAPPTTAAGKSTRESAFIDSVNLAAHTVTIDPMMFLTGQAAITAFKKAHPTASEGPTDDYYIVNPTVGHVVLTLPATAIVKLVQVNGQTHNLPVPATQAMLASYASLSTHPFWITVTGTTVSEIDEQFVP